MVDDDVTELTVAGRSVVAVDDEAAYRECARRTDPHKASLPLLLPAWQGFRSSIGSLPIASEAAPGQWRGTVLVGDPRFTPVGEVLARGTGRPLRQGDFAEAVVAATREPVTLVVDVSTITPERLASIPHDAKLGLFVARSLAAASALAVRTVLHGPAAAGSWGDLSFDVAAMEQPRPGRLAGAGVTPEELRETVGGGVAVLTGRSHARDCVLHLNGGGICGRAQTDPLLPVLPPIADDWLQHPTACQQGRGCWRDDLEVSDHLRASDVRAAFVMLDGCLMAVAGQGRVRTDASVPLTMLEGSAVAVAAAVGTRKGSAHAGQLFQALIRSGLTLGEALSEVNGVIECDPTAMGRLALFGDAGLIPAPTGTTPWAAPLQVPGETSGMDIPRGTGATLVNSAGTLMARSPEGPLALPRAEGGSSWVLTEAVGRRGGAILDVPGRIDEVWYGRVAPWLERMHDLAQLVRGDVTPLDAIRRTALSAVRRRAKVDHAEAARETVHTFDTAVDELAAYQFQLVSKEIAWIRTNFYRFWDAWTTPWSVRSERPVEQCPQCGDTSATWYHVRPHGGTGLALCYVNCVRCGEVLSGAAEFGADVEVHSPPEAPLGEPFTVGVTVSAPADRPLAVAVGVAIPNEQRMHFRLADAQHFEVRPGEPRRVDFTGIGDLEKAKPDAQPVIVLVAVDGAIRCLTRHVWTRIQPSREASSQQAEVS